MTYHNAAAVLADPATAVVERAPLTRAFDVVANAVERRTSVPILENARLLGDGSQMFVTGTDMDLEITVAVPAAADSRFKLTLPAIKLKELLKKATASDFVAFTMPPLERMPETPRCPEHDEFTGPATVDFERVKYRLNALPESDFPVMAGPDAATANRFTLTGTAFWNAIDSTMGAVSTEETRYYLNGIFMHAHESGELRMVATDGHRLYLQALPCPDGAAGMSDVILPRKTVAVLHKLMKGKACPDAVVVEVTRARIRFQWDDITVTSKLIDGTFPDYQRVTPTDHDKAATFDPATMLEGIRAVTLISSERGRSVKLTLSPGSCELSVNSPETGSAVSEISCSFDGETGFECGYNAGYLVEILATASPDGKAVAWYGTDAGSPATLTGSREGWKAVLMPLRV